VREAQIFVGVLGASNYTYAEATWTQGLEDWIGSHVSTFEYFGAVPECTGSAEKRLGWWMSYRLDRGTFLGTVAPAPIARPRSRSRRIG